MQVFRETNIIACLDNASERPCVEVCLVLFYAQCSFDINILKDKSALFILYVLDSISINI